MDKPQPRYLTLDLTTVTYFGDWIVNFEKTIQAMTIGTASEMPKVSSIQKPQEQPRGSQ